MKKQGTVVIIPVNDAEAILIAQLAQAFGIETILSKQQHGASLDGGRDYVSLIKKGKWKQVVIIEMPGVKSEEKIRNLGCDLTIIDHHNYTGLERSHHPETGRMLPSSLEQFLKLFQMTPAKLTKQGFDPKLVKGIGILDRSFIWGLQKAHYSKKEIQEVIRYQKDLLLTIRPSKDEQVREQAAKQAWKEAKKWGKYFVVISKSDFHLRSALSFYLAELYGKPIPLILLEKGEKRIYVQESDKSTDLYRTFGGFTYGTHQNWGYRNDREEKKITLENVLKVIAQKSKKKK